MEPEYVKQFEDQLSHRMRRKQYETINYPDDIRVHEKPRRVRLEPPSQIQQQSIMNGVTYTKDSLSTFTKPLINAQVSPQNNINLGNVRYNHNFSYFGSKYRSQDNIFKKEPKNIQQTDYYQRDYQPQTKQESISLENHNLYQNNQYQNTNARMNYSQVGNMLIKPQNQQEINQQQQTHNQQAYLNQNAGSPALYSGKFQDTQQPYYGPRALKNLDSSQLY